MESKSLFGKSEQQFLEALVELNVEFLLIGAAAAALQGAPVVTQDVDLWFHNIGDEKVREAAAAVDGVLASGFGVMPPTFAGGGIELFDIVLNPQGLDSFEEEYSRALAIDLDGIYIPVMSLERIIVSKEAANREKDRVVLPAMREALEVLKRMPSPPLWMHMHNKVNPSG